MYQRGKSIPSDFIEQHEENSLCEKGFHLIAMIHVIEVISYDLTDKNGREFSALVVSDARLTHYESDPSQAQERAIKNPDRKLFLYEGADALRDAHKDISERVGKVYEELDLFANWES